MDSQSSSTRPRARILPVVIDTATSPLWGPFVDEAWLSELADVSPAVDWRPPETLFDRLGSMRNSLGPHSMRGTEFPKSGQSSALEHHRFPNVLTCTAAHDQGITRAGNRHELVQIGLLDLTGLPVTGAGGAAKLRNPALPDPFFNES